MEVYSTRKPVNSRVTLAATGVLILIAILQSVSMVDQKRKDWDALLGDAVSIDPTFQIRIPKRWQAVNSPGTGWLVFKGELASPPAPAQLWIQRISLSGELSRDQILEYSLTLAEVKSPFEALQPLECDLGGADVLMYGVQFGVIGLRQTIVRVVVAADDPRGITVLMLKVEGSEDETVRGLLRYIAATANFEDRSK